ncbi:MFS transporter [Sphingomonas jatrophae]|nr:MFS transporter [Sphingomonas jatrophae]
MRATAAAVERERGPLSVPAFRAIWTTSLLGNAALLILGVGASWAMTDMTSSPRLVAAVQTALMLPVMLLSMAAGAVADMYDRRRVVLAALSLASGGAALLTLLAAAGLVTPGVLLVACFLIGCGVALAGPSWQGSAAEQVPPPLVAPAIALNSISYNVARSLGPAAGGVIVKAGGAVAAFGAAAILYLPLIAAFFAWRRVREPSRLPPERLGYAIGGGLRYIVNAPPVRALLVRLALTGLLAGSLSGLMPLVVRDILGGGAGVYGLMLGIIGAGALTGALTAGELRRRYPNEWLVRAGTAITGSAYLVVALSPSLWLTAPALFAMGAAWMVFVTVMNIGVQLLVPRWVAGRALAGYQAAIMGGLALGSWSWGQVAGAFGVAQALIVSGVVTLGAVLLGRWFPMPREATVEEGSGLATPAVALALTARSGPITIEIGYRVDPARAREFYTAMQEVRLIRKRNGAYQWLLSRDVAAPDAWLERYHYLTWADYLRQRDRRTAEEEAFERDMLARLVHPDGIVVRRWLERPFGSVRWKDETPDPGQPAGV